MSKYPFVHHLLLNTVILTPNSHNSPEHTICKGVCIQDSEKYLEGKTKGKEGHIGV